MTGTDRTARLYAPTHSDSVAAWARRYLDALAVRQYASGTVAMVRQDLAHFNVWCIEREIASPREVTKPILERFQRYLFYYRKDNGQPLAIRRQSGCLVHLKGYFRWLVKGNHLPHNPASDLELPRAPAKQLRMPLSAEQLEDLMRQPDIDDALGLRDRAILEVLYSTGVRRAEVLALCLTDIDPRGGTVFVRQGKGKKDRVVPIGERALAWVDKYLIEVRPALVVDPHTAHVFLGREGAPLGREALTLRVRGYCRKAGILTGSCHLLRHTMATQMLDHGADIRFIQEILGHAKLDTTQGYTHVSIAKLKAVHAATHPGAKLARRTETSTPERDDSAPAPLSVASADAEDSAPRD